MKLSHCTIPSRHILFLTLLTILTRLPSYHSVLKLSARITDGSDVTESDVDRILSVPTNAQLILNCSSTDDDAIDWRTTALQSPLYNRYTRHSLARISAFKQLNTGEYTCYTGREEAKLFADLGEVSTLPNPGHYHAYESERVTLSACVSAYPSLKNSLAVTWSHLGVELPNCYSQGTVGCLECQVTVTDFSTTLNYSFEATSQSHLSTQILFVTVHNTPAVVSPLPPSTSVLQCQGLALTCVGTGDQTLYVEWRHTPANSPSAVLSTGDGYRIETSTELSPQDGQYYTTSVLSIRPAGLAAEGAYTCSFIGYGERRSSTTVMLYVVAQLCLQRKITSAQYDPIPGSSVQVLDTGQGSEVFLCFGDDVSWHQNGAPVPYDGDVYQAVVFGGLFIRKLSEPSYFYCHSASSSLQTWIYATQSNPTVVTRPSGTLYKMLGQNVSVHAYLSRPGGLYTLDWFYLVEGVRRNVTELGWSINQLSAEEEDYFEVSISLSRLEESHSGVIGVEYSVGGQLTSSQVSLFLLPSPDLVLLPIHPLRLWEGSSVEVECLLRNESVPISVSPHWIGVPSCTSQTEVCSQNQTLRLSNVSLSADGIYTCTADNEAGHGNTSLQVTVTSLSPQLLLLTGRFRNRTLTVVNAEDSLYLNSASGSLLLSCSLDNSSSSALYLNTTATWVRDPSYSHAVSINGSYLTVDTLSIFSSHQDPFNTSFCCLAQLDEFRGTQKCLKVTFDISSPAPTPTPVPTDTTHIVIFLSVENCTMVPSPDPLAPIRLALLDATRAQCACNLSDTELHLSHFSCHTDLVSNSPKHLLILCGASTHSLYQLLKSDSLAQLNFSLANLSMVVSSVTDSHVGTHCETTPPTTITPLPTTIPVNLPTWSKVLLYGAFPVLLLLLIVVLILILAYICYNFLYRAGSKSKSFTVTDGDQEMTELPDALQTLVESDRYLIPTQVTLSPSQIPQTFKAASYPTYSPESPPPQELLSRPASSPPKQGEFPVMYSNPLAFDGSGELYSASSFTNFNNNRNYSSDMPRETAGHYPAHLTTHRVSLQWPATAASVAARASISRDPAHSSLPSPLRSARRYAMQRRLSQQKSRAYPPSLYHQLKIRHPPPPPPPSAKISRYETPTFDSGVEEMESTHPRSSSASSYSEVSADEPPPRVRASSLATSFPQHAHAVHVRSHSTELERISSLPNFLKPSATSFTSQGTKLELYRTVKKDQQGSQTLV